MPNEPWVWAVAIVAFAVVVLVALWKGGKVEVGVDPLRLKFKRGVSPLPPHINVLQGAEIEDAEVGDITALEVAHDRTRAATPTVELGRRLKVKGGRLGDISGVKQRSGVGGAKREG